MQNEIRVVRVPLPVDLIRRMDALILEGRAGLGSRADLIREAIEAMVLELTYGVEEPPTAPRAPAKPGAVGASSAISGPLDQDDAFTVLTAPSQVDELLEPALSPAAGGPMFGMHNRDYPSLWAARVLAELTAKGPRPIDDVLNELTERAWKFGDRLLQIDKVVGGKPSAVFPTNRSKPQSAADGFRMFAVGSVASGDGGRCQTSGPLFEWSVCSAVRRGEATLMGMTQEGIDLLQRMHGIAVRQPHERAHARAFLDHLHRHARHDWKALLAVCRALRDNPSRPELLERMGNVWGEVSASEVSTNASGYVARAREWGLVEPKQVRGEYALSAFGIEIVESEVNGVG